MRNDVLHFCIFSKRHILSFSWWMQFTVCALSLVFRNIESNALYTSQAKPFSPLWKNIAKIWSLKDGTFCDPFELDEKNRLKLLSNYRKPFVSQAFSAMLFSLVSRRFSWSTRCREGTTNSPPTFSTSAFVANIWMVNSVSSSNLESAYRTSRPRATSEWLCGLPLRSDLWCLLLPFSHRPRSLNVAFVGGRPPWTRTRHLTSN